MQTDIKPYHIKDKDGALILSIIPLNKTATEKLNDVMEKHLKNPPVNIQALVSDFLEDDKVFAILFFGEATRKHFKREVPQDKGLLSKDNSVAMVIAAENMRLAFSQEEFMPLISSVLEDSEMREAVLIEIERFLEDEE